jgi:HAD superfamily hydrolase (TIGR01509 family)
VLRAALFDLDGVLRRFDPALPARLEAEAGLPPGTLHRIAFAPEHVDPAVDGRHTFEQWRNAVGDALHRHHGVADGRGLADRLLAVEHGSLDGEVLALVRRLRSGGTRVGVLTNATSRLLQELAVLGVAPEVDVVCNSSELGVAKPHERAFRLAAERLGVEPAECFFTDDTLRHVEAAAAAGLTAHHFTGADGLAHALRTAGLLP